MPDELSSHSEDLKSKGAAEKGGLAFGWDWEAYIDQVLLDQRAGGSGGEKGAVKFCIGEQMDVKAAEEYVDKGYF